MTIPNPETSARKIAAREAAAQALELRKSGASFASIARAVGRRNPDTGAFEPHYKDESGARKAVSTLLKRMEYEGVDEFRTLELARLDGMWLAIAKGIAQGNFGAIDRGLKIMDRRAKLLGLDRPAQMQMTDEDGKPIPVMVIGMNMNEL